MAEVFAGHAHGSHGFQKPVAIKRLLPELANDKVFVERLIGEAKLLISLQHGNIVSVLDLARDGEDVFLVMEYVDGPSLRQLLKGRGTRGLPLAIASYIVQSAAAGLEFAHARPGGAIVHADISPSNILLSTSGEVRVADFGIARREGNGAGVVEGKWAYMAPEQARGESLSPRSDVFALGIVLYELITGQHPLGKQVNAEARDSGPIRIVPPRIVNPQVPAGLDAICMKALAENARDRYARMQQMIDAIVDERFTSGWREGASDLAGLIRELKPAAVSAGGPRTQVTDRPVTIMTRSLISESALLKRRASAPQMPSKLDYVSPLPPDGTPSRDFDSIEATNDVHAPIARGSVPMVPSSSPVVPVMPAAIAAQDVQLQGMPALPAGILVAPTPEEIAAAAAQAYQRMSSPMLADEMASVHGGHTLTGAAAIDMRDARSNKWTFAVLGIAALLGVIAAVAISVAPHESKPELKAQPEATVQPAPVKEQPAVAVTQQPAPLVEQRELPTVPSAPDPTAAPAAAAASDVPTVETAANESPPTTSPATVAGATQQAATDAQPSATDTQPPASDTQPPASDGQPAATDTKQHKTRSFAAKPAGKADKTLRLESDGGIYAIATINGVRYEVPNGKVKLAAGRYTVAFENRDMHKKVTCSVALTRDVQSLKVFMEDGQCVPY
jgi:serine/threonine protein kinase